MAAMALDRPAPRLSVSDNSLPDPDHEVLPNGGARARMVVLGCCAAMFATFGVAGSVGIMQVYWITHQLKHSSENSVAWITGVNMFLILFIPVYIGPVFDRYGARVLLGCSSLFYVVSFVLLAQCEEYWHFMLVYGILNSCAGACVSTVALSAPAQWYDEKRGLALGIVCAGSSVGGVSVPFLLSYSLAHLSFAWAMRILALVSLVLLIIANICVIERVRSTRPWKAVGLRWLRNSTFMWTTLGTALFEFALISSIALIPSYAVGQGFTTNQASNAIAMLNAGSAIGRLLSGWLADRVGRFNVMAFVLAFSITASLCIWMFVYQNLATLYIAILLYGLGCGSIVSLAGACFGQLCKADEYGECWGTAYVFVSFVVLISVPTGEALLRKLGGQGYIACLGGILTVALSAIFMARWSILEYRWKTMVKV